MDNIKDEEFITTPELCEWLKISKATVSRWRNEGMPFTGKVRSYRYKKTEILKWLEEQKNKEK